MTINVSLILLIAAQVQESLSAVAPFQRFYMRGVAVLDRGAPSESLSELVWARVPKPADLPSVNWQQITYDSTFNADCKVRSNGVLANCELSYSLPDTPLQNALYRKLLAGLRLDPKIVARLKSNETVGVFARIENPSGTNKDKFFCGPPFCSAVPAPPRVRPAPPDRG